MIKAVIFDLDGVIVSTDDCHYRAWQALADREGIEFSRAMNERLRGVSRMECLDILLERCTREYTNTEKVEMATWKNDCYRKMLDEITSNDILPGVMEWLKDLKARKIKTAIGSSSRNAGIILKHIGMENEFETVVDGNDIQRSKPDPEVFVMAATQLQVEVGDCLVVEDAEAGVSAALAAGMQCLAVGSAKDDPRSHFAVSDLSKINVKDILFQES